MTAIQHCSMKITVRLEDMRGLWVDLNDKQRLEVLKSLIWTAPDQHVFKDKALRAIKKLTVD